MNKVAGNICFEQEVSFHLDNIFFIKISNRDGTYNYFFYWKTYKKRGIDVLDELEKQAWVKSISKEVSISGEDDIDVFFDRQLDWVYTSISVEW